MCICAFRGAPLDILRCLVNDLGADVNIASRGGATPLILAVQEGKLAAVKCLVTELGANVNKIDNGGATPLIIATQAGELAAVKCLVTELGADVNQAHTDNGCTPLETSICMCWHACSNLARTSTRQRIMDVGPCWWLRVRVASVSSAACESMEQTSTKCLLPELYP
jgi:hypothetical protein